LVETFDLINFYNELDLLCLRFETLDPVVDHFIISESTVTFSGLNKPMFFAENRDRYKKFEKKIIYQVITDTPEDYLNLSPDIARDPLHRTAIERVNKADWWPHNILTYGRNTFQKESLIRALTICQPDDIIMTSDTDEISNPEKVREVIENFDPAQVYNFKLRNYIFYFNLCNGEPWNGGQLLTCKKLITEAGLCELKQHRRGIFVEDGGWHFSYMGGAAKVKEKLDALAEPELTHVTGDIGTTMENCIANGLDLYRRNYGIWQIPIAYETHPKYLVENQDKFKDYIK